MQEHDEMNEHEDSFGAIATGPNHWLVIAIVALLAVAGVAFGYGYRQQTLVRHLTAQQSVADSTISQMQGQLSAVTSKLNDMTTAQAQVQAQAQAQAQAEVAKQADKKTVAGAARTGVKRASVTDKRYKQLQSQLPQQQKALKDTQEQKAKKTTDLEGKLSSTPHELKGSTS